MNELMFTLLVVLFFYQIVLMSFMIQLVRKQRAIEERFAKQEKSIILLVKVLGVIKNDINGDIDAEFTKGIEDELYREARDGLF